ncbi:MAG: murein biosynthesis integral membrane protein MurJ [Bacillota bacterium]|nr:murein biosynthesis integral membrane protein MurJ [Bacillota bacterium]
MEKGFVIRAAAFLMVIQVLSRLLGYARDSLLLNTFGQSYITDAYNAAFRIPDFIYNILIGGAISAAFIPVFSSYIANKDSDEAWKVSSIFSSWVLSLMLAGCLFSFIYAEPLLSWLVQFEEAEMALPVTLMRITLVQAIFMALSAIATGILQSYQHFTWPAIGTLLYNICIILGGVFLVRPIEAAWPGYGVAGFSVGVVAGAILTLVVQVPMLKKVGFRYRLCFDTRNPGLRQLVKLIIPVLIGLSVTQINLFITQYLATGLEDGLYTTLLTANRFFQLPLGVFAIAICTAIFPTMTQQAAVGELDEMKKSLSLGVRNISFVLLPSAVGLIMLREPIIRLLYEFSGKFTAYDTQIASQALLYYCIGLIAYGAAMALIRGFYAMQNTLTPVLVSVLAIVLNIVFSLLLVGPMGHRGLAFAYSLAGFAQCGFLLIFLRLKLGRMDLRHMLMTLFKTAVACLVMALAVWGANWGCELIFGIGSKLGQLLQVAVGIGVGVAVFFAAAYAMKMEELRLVLQMLKRRRAPKGDKSAGAADSDAQNTIEGLTDD